MIRWIAVSVTEIAAMADVTRPAVSNWRARHDDFPKPIQELACGPIWSFAEVESYLERRHGIKPGGRLAQSVLKKIIPR